MENENTIRLEDLIGLDSEGDGGYTPSSEGLRDIFDDGINPNTDDIDTPEEVVEDPVDPTAVPTPEPDIDLSDKNPTTDPVEPTEGETISNEGLNQYYNILKDTGILQVSDDFEFDGSVEALTKALEETATNLPKYAMNSFWEMLPDEWKPALEYAVSGGTDIQAYLDTFKSVPLESLDIENSVEDQRKVLKAYYERTLKGKRDSATIDRMIDKVHLYGEMQEEALEALSYLREQDQIERQKLADDQAAIKKADEEKAIKYRNDVLSSIDSLNIENTKKNKVKAFLFNTSAPTVEEEPSTQLQQYLHSIENNANHLAELANLLLDTYTPSKGFDFSRFTKKASSQAASQLQERLSNLQSNTKTKLQGSGNAMVVTDIDWDELLKQN